MIVVIEKIRIVFIRFRQAKEDRNAVDVVGDCEFDDSVE